MMNRCNGWTVVWVGFACGSIAALSAWSAEVELGTPRDEVIEKLGKPDGSASMRGIEVLYYVRGIVDLEGGEVIRSSVLSEAEFEAEQQRLAEAAEARRRAAAEAAEQRRAEGQERLQAIRDQDALAGKSPSERLAYWKGFQRRYPEVSVAAEIREAEAAIREQKEAAVAFERKVQEEMSKPVPGMSSRKLRKFRRGRSKSAVAAREASVRDVLKEQMDTL